MSWNICLEILLVRFLSGYGDIGTQWASTANSLIEEAPNKEKKIGEQIVLEELAVQKICRGCSVFHPHITTATITGFWEWESRKDCAMFLQMNFS